MLIPVSKRVENNKLVIEKETVDKSKIIDVGRAVKSDCFMPVYVLKFEDGSTKEVSLELLQDFKAMNYDEFLEFEKFLHEQNF